MAVAAERAPVELTDAMELLVRSVEKGRCPGDDFADRVIDHGIAAEVSRARSWRKGSVTIPGNGSPTIWRGRARGRCGWSISTTPNCFASTTR